MCGISGIVSSTGAATEARAAAMCATLAHRGPDSSGVVDGRDVRPRRAQARDHRPRVRRSAHPERGRDGARRLERRDLQLRGPARRPRAGRRTSSGLTATRRCWRISTSSTATDSRPACAACSPIAIWDARQRRLVLARDRFGIKPLYYSEGGGKLCFASELRAPPTQARSTSTRWSPSSPSTSCRRPLTILRGCTEAAARPPPRLGGRADPARALRRRDPRPGGGGPARARQPVLAAELRERLRDSVRRPLVSGRPGGRAALGRGSTRRDHRARGERRRPGSLHTFSARLRSRSFDESDDARLVAERYGATHHEIVVRPEAAKVATLLGEVFDEPFADSSALPTYLVSRAGVPAR